MNHGPKAAGEFFAACQEAWPKLSESVRGRLAQGDLQLLLFTPDVSFTAARTSAQNLPIRMGAQNVHWEKAGAFTGEISAAMCAELGIQSALTGHSERRQYFGETDETVRKRTVSLVDAGFCVFLCVGETLAERDAGQTEAVLTRQLGEVFQPQLPLLSKALQDRRLVVAYEPVWAIGTGKTATPEMAQATHQQIRSILAQRLSPDVAQQATLVYGGSVTPANLQGLLQQPDIDGALVGGASLKPDSWLQLVEIAGNSFSG